MKNPKISIIVPVYNVEQYLPRCINSILVQTFIDFELLLIDDGSTDNSGKICNDYAENDKRIRVFHKENGGVSSARNLGLDNAQGEWIVFVDSDDWVDDTWLEKYNDSIDMGTDIIFQGYVREELDNKQTFHYYDNNKGQETGNIIYELEQRNLFGWTWIKIFKADIIKKYQLRFNLNMSISEDLIFTIEYCLHIKNRIKVLSSTTYHYFNTPNSLFKKLISYEEVKIKTELIYSFRMKLYNKFPSDNSYRQWIELANKNQAVSLLKSLYWGQKTYSKYSLYSILKDIRQLTSNYTPNNILGKVLIKTLQLFKNNYWANLFLKVELNSWKFIKENM